MSLSPLVAATDDNTPPAPDDQSAAPAMRVARLTYGGIEQGRCFAAGFLDDFARATGLEVAREFDVVPLDDPAVFAYPFVVLGGDKAFELSDAEADCLRAYIAGGGFVIASASCSSEPWASSFERAMARVSPGGAFESLAMGHPLFTALYEIDELQTWQVVDTPPRLRGLSIEGRLAVLYAPMGLHDTDEGGEGCCCCGANELRNARQINANALAYALLH